MVKTGLNTGLNDGGFGSELAGSFHCEAPPTLIAHTERNGLRLAVTEIDCNDSPHGFTEPIAQEDAFLIGLQLRGLRYHELWLDSRPVPVSPIAPGTTHFYDLARSPTAFSPEPSHPLFFYMPRAALAEQARELGMPEVGDLTYTPGQFLDDPVIRSLGLSLLPVLQARAHAHQILVDHTLLAVRSYLVAAYGVARARPATGCARGLSTLQANRARELMDARLADGVDLYTVAQACGMDATRFASAFRRTTGLTPHAWMSERRLHRALLSMYANRCSADDAAARVGMLNRAELERAFFHKTGVALAAYWKWVRDERNVKSLADV